MHALSVTPLTTTTPRGTPLNRWWRRGLALGAAAALLPSALWAAALNGLDVPPSGPLVVPGFHTLPVAVIRANEAFTPLSDRYLLDVLGSDIARFLERPEPPAQTPPRTPSSAPNPGLAPPRDDDPIALPEVPVRFTALALSMSADRSRVHAGDVINYLITVANVGNEEFFGEIRVDTHHPFFTTDATDPCENDPSDGCVSINFPTPGPPTEEIHTASFTRSGPIPARTFVSFRLRVRVDPATPSGTRLANHAHLLVPGAEERNRNSDVVVVTVR